MNKEKKLKILIRKILDEDLGKIKMKALKGYAPSTPYYVKAGKESLGQSKIKRDDILDSPEEMAEKEKTKKERKPKIKISKAFLDQDESEL